MNCFGVTKNKTDQKFCLKILASGRLKAQSNCYKKHSRAFILYSLYIFLYIVFDTILGNLLQFAHLFID